MSGFRIDASDVFKGLAKQQMKTMLALQILARSSASKMKTHAKQNRPWTDRTGHARGTIEGGVEHYGDKMDIYVCGNMEYSPYLEFANEKKYAILWPTIEMFSPKIYANLSKIIEKA